MPRLRIVQTFVALVCSSLAACILDSTLLEVVDPVLERIELTPDAHGGIATAINEAGEVTGRSTASDGSRAFRWRNGLTLTLDDPETQSSQGLVINERGDIAGSALYADGGRVERRAFLWTRDSLIDLGTMGGIRSTVNQVGESGHVVGSIQIDESGASQAYVWLNGVATFLPSLGGDRSAALDVNSDGVIVGNATKAGGVARAVRWQGGTVEDLGALGGGVSSARAINDAGLMIGSSRTSAEGRCFHESNEARDCHAVIWSADGTIIDLGTLGGSVSGPRDINARGEVVGNSMTVHGELHAFLWQDGEMVDLGTLGGQTSTAVAINDDGYIVGSSETSGHENHAFVWFEGVMYDLGAQSGASQATDVNGRLEVVGLDQMPVLWRIVL